MRHRAWHRGLMMLEEEAEKIPAFTGNPVLLQIFQPEPINMQLVCGVERSFAFSKFPFIFNSFF